MNESSSFEEEWADEEESYYDEDVVTDDEDDDLKPRAPFQASNGRLNRRSSFGDSISTDDDFSFDGSATIEFELGSFDGGADSDEEEPEDLEKACRELIVLTRPRGSSYDADDMIRHCDLKNLYRNLKEQHKFMKHSEKEKAPKNEKAQDWESFEDGNEVFSVDDIDGFDDDAVISGGAFGVNYDGNGDMPAQDLKSKGQAKVCPPDVDFSDPWGSNNHNLRVFTTSNAIIPDAETTEVSDDEDENDVTMEIAGNAPLGSNVPVTKKGNSIPWLERNSDDPDDYEAACRSLIPLVYKNQEVEQDLDTMLRRSNPKDLYRHLKQQHWYLVHMGAVSQNPLDEIIDELVPLPFQKNVSLDDIWHFDNKKNGSASQRTMQNEQFHIKSLEDNDQGKLTIPIVIEDTPQPNQEESKIVNWLERHSDDPEDYENANLKLIAILYKQDDEDVDLEATLKRCTPKALFRYLKQQFWYQVYMGAIAENALEQLNQVFLEAEENIGQSPNNLQEAVSSAVLENIEPSPTNRGTISSVAKQQEMGKESTVHEQLMRIYEQTTRTEQENLEDSKISFPGFTEYESIIVMDEDKSLVIDVDDDSLVESPVAFATPQESEVILHQTAFSGPQVEFEEYEDEEFEEFEDEEFEVYEDNLLSTDSSSVDAPEVSDDSSLEPPSLEMLKQENRQDPELLSLLLSQSTHFARSSSDSALSASDSSSNHSDQSSTISRDENESSRIQVNQAYRQLILDQIGDEAKKNLHDKIQQGAPPETTQDALIEDNSEGDDQSFAVSLVDTNNLAETGRDFRTSPSDQMNEDIIERADKAMKQRPVIEVERKTSLPNLYPVLFNGDTRKTKREILSDSTDYEKGQKKARQDQSIASNMLQKKGLDVGSEEADRYILMDSDDDLTEESKDSDVSLDSYRERELMSIVSEAEEHLDEAFEIEAIKALKAATLKTTHLKKYYDVHKDVFLLVPPVAKAIIDDTLIEEASTYYCDGEEDFPIEYTAVLRTAASKTLDDDVDYDYIDKIAINVELIDEWNKEDFAMDSWTKFSVEETDEEESKEDTDMRIVQSETDKRKTRIDVELSRIIAETEESEAEVKNETDLIIENVESLESEESKESGASTFSETEAERKVMNTITVNIENVESENPWEEIPVVEESQPFPDISDESLSRTFGADSVVFDFPAPDESRPTFSRSASNWSITNARVYGQTKLKEETEVLDAIIAVSQKSVSSSEEEESDQEDDASSSQSDYSGTPEDACETNLASVEINVERREADKRKERIEEELMQIVFIAEERELEGSLEEEVVSALKIAAFKTCHLKRYYNVFKDEIVYLPPVAKAILDYSLIEEASKHYVEERGDFSMMYSGALRAVASSVLDADMDYEMMNMIAVDIEGLDTFEDPAGQTNVSGSSSPSTNATKKDMKDVAMVDAHNQAGNILNGPGESLSTFDSQTAAKVELKKRKARIEDELQRILLDAEESQLNESFEPEARMALKIAAIRTSHLKKYYDFVKDTLIFLPSVAKAVSDNSLMEEASKHYCGGLKVFPPKYTAALKVVAGDALDASLDYQYMENAAVKLDVEFDDKIEDYKEKSVLVNYTTHDILSEGKKQLEGKEGSLDKGTISSDAKEGNVTERNASTSLPVQCLENEEEVANLKLAEKGRLLYSDYCKEKEKLMKEYLELEQTKEKEERRISFLSKALKKRRKSEAEKVVNESRRLEEARRVDEAIFSQKLQGLHEKLFIARGNLESSKKRFEVEQSLQQISESDSEDISGRLFGVFGVKKKVSDLAREKKDQIRLIEHQMEEMEINQEVKDIETAVAELSREATNLEQIRTVKQEILYEEARLEELSLISEESKLAEDTLCLNQTVEDAKAILEESSKLLVKNWAADEAWLRKEKAAITKELERKQVERMLPRDKRTSLEFEEQDRIKNHPLQMRPKGTRHEVNDMRLKGTKHEVNGTKSPSSKVDTLEGRRKSKERLLGVCVPDHLISTHQPKSNRPSDFESLAPTDIFDSLCLPRPDKPFLEAARKAKEALNGREKEYPLQSQSDRQNIPFEDTALVPDHLMGAHQPKSNRPPDVESLVSADIFDSPSPSRPDKPFLDAARKAKEALNEGGKHPQAVSGVGRKILDDKSERYRKEFEALLERDEGGVQIDEDRLYFLQLYARCCVGEELTLEERLDLEEFEEEEKKKDHIATTYDHQESELFSPSSVSSSSSDLFQHLSDLNQPQTLLLSDDTSLGDDSLFDLPKPHFRGVFLAAAKRARAAQEEQQQQMIDEGHDEEENSEEVSTSSPDSLQDLSDPNQANTLHDSDITSLKDDILFDQPKPYLRGGLLAEAKRAGATQEQRQQTNGEEDEKNEEEKNEGEVTKSSSDLFQHLSDINQPKTLYYSGDILLGDSTNILFDPQKQKHEVGDLAAAEEARAVQEQQNQTIAEEGEEDVIENSREVSAFLSDPFQHLTHLCQPKNLCDNDDISLGDDVLFDLPKPHLQGGFLAAAKRARAAQEQQYQMTTEEDVDKEKSEVTSTYQSVTEKLVTGERIARETNKASAPNKSLAEKRRKASEAREKALRARGESKIPTFRSGSTIPSFPSEAPKNRSNQELNNSKTRKLNMASVDESDASDRLLWWRKNGKRLVTEKLSLSVSEVNVPPKTNEGYDSAEPQNHFEKVTKGADSSASLSVVNDSTNGSLSKRELLIEKRKKIVEARRSQKHTAHEAKEQQTGPENGNAALSEIGGLSKAQKQKKRIEEAQRLSKRTARAREVRLAREAELAEQTRRVELKGLILNQKILSEETNSSVLTEATTASTFENFQKNDEMLKSQQTPLFLNMVQEVERLSGILSRYEKKLETACRSTLSMAQKDENDGEARAAGTLPLPNMYAFIVERNWFRRIASDDFSSPLILSSSSPSAAAEVIDYPTTGTELYRVTKVGETFLRMDGPVQADVGRFLASLVHAQDGLSNQALKQKWENIARLSGDSQNDRILENIDDMIVFCVTSGLLNYGNL
jgi:hypothetical protein